MDVPTTSRPPTDLTSSPHLHKTCVEDQKALSTHQKVPRDLVNEFNCTRCVPMYTGLSLPLLLLTAAAGVAAAAVGLGGCTIKWMPLHQNGLSCILPLSDHMQVGHRPRGSTTGRHTET